MLIKLAGIVLAGSLLTLGVAGVTGWGGRDFDNWEVRHRIRERVHVRHGIEQEALREHRAALREQARALREQMEHVRESVESAEGDAETAAAVEVEAADVPAAAAEPALPAVAGANTYVFDASGNPFGKLPWSAHVELQLQKDDRYELRVRTKIDSEVQEEVSSGRYRIRGDRVTIYSAHDDDTHEFRLDGDKLMFNADWLERLALKAVGIEQTYMTLRR
jgi:hypothetical protein